VVFSDDSKHKYQILENWIRSRIFDGTYSSGQKIPSENKLAEQFAVSRQTVRQAIMHLEKKGTLVSRRGSGTYVTEITRAMTIGYMAASITDYIFPGITSGIESVLTENGYSMTLGVTRNRVETEHQLLLSLMNKGVDGIIVDGIRSALPNPNLPLYRELTDKGIPYVFINGYYEALDPVYVVTNDRAGGRLAVDYLYRLGHRRIGGIFKGDDRQGHERYAGFSEEMVRHNFPMDDDEVIWYTTPDIERLFARSEETRLLRRLQKCTAVVCYNDQVAIRLVQAMLRNGVRIPMDKSIIGFDNSSISELSPVRITSVTHPGELLGKEAAKRLLEMIESGIRSKSLVMDVDLIIKDSTGTRNTSDSVDLLTLYREEI